ncbi:hypothetical protein ACIBKY_55100 [Nonomuraea sp. NPDC050394]|uniref:hypothetical protein n=1 Tax=Nonomuraea sp. NPDC050394 TaxID=3364363 RepID=UPI00378877A3
MTATRPLNQLPAPAAAATDRPSEGPVFLTYHGEPYQLWHDRIVLDWTTRTGCKHQHWGGGPRRPCRFCHHLCWLIDMHSRPVHKVCLEQAITTTLLSRLEKQAA